MSIDDDAERLEQLDRDICMKIRRPILPITGYCHWCGDEAKGCYCSPECREDYNKHKKFNN